MDSERAKVAELQANQAAMAQQLAAAKTQELAQRQELDTVSDEINQLRRRHARELEDREDAMRRKEREVRELRRANEILKTSAAFFAAAELDRKLR